MNGWRRAAVAAMSCASLACGGKIADDVATTDDDAAVDATTDGWLGWAETGPPVADGGPPSSGSCGYPSPQISNDSNGVCSLSQTWTCADGGDLYELQCNCWAQTCECYKNNDKMLAFGFPNCPSCIASPDVIAKCPFPH